MNEHLSLVIPRPLKKKLDELKKFMHLDQSSLLRQLLTEAVDIKRLEIAIKEYQEGKLSLGKATEIAGTSLWRLLDEMRKKNVALDYEITDAIEEIQAINSNIYQKHVSKKKEKL